MASSNQSPKPASQQPTNPWEVSVSEESTASSPSFPRPVTVEFNGTLDAKQIRKFYHNPTQFGCLLPLVLLSAFIWGFPFYMLVGIAGPLIAAIIALLVILGMYRKLLGTGKVEKLIRIRPWLIGQTHGVVSGGRWTVWHNDFCMQTTTPEAECWSIHPPPLHRHSQWFQALVSLNPAGAIYFMITSPTAPTLL